MVVDRATRGENRHVLILTEQRVLPESGPDGANGASDDSELRALLADAISEAVQSGVDGEPEWIPDPEPRAAETTSCAAWA